MATSRLDIRLNEQIKLKAERAVSLLGLKSLTEYVVKLIDEDSTQVISKYQNLTLKDNLFDNFTKACDEIKEPNKQLKDALNFTKGKGL
jgi:uncharacterized protein (DUF1778 family)